MRMKVGKMCDLCSPWVDVKTARSLARHSPPCRRGAGRGVNSEKGPGSGGGMGDQAMQIRKQRGKPTF